MTVINLGRATYLGGLPGRSGQVTGRLWLTDEALGIGDVFPTQPRIDIADILAIEVDTAEVTKSKVPAAIAFGVVGALTARGSAKRTAMTVQLRGGDVAFLQLEDMDVPTVTGLLAPWKRAHLPAAPTEPPEPATLADQLERVTELFRSGALTADEFSTAKRQILAR